MLFIIAGIGILGGIFYIVAASRETYDIRRVKGVQKPGETEQQYEQRLRAKLKKNGKLLILSGVVLMASAIALEVLP
ncbi:hypothetical protein [Brevibacillus sp. 179-C9.3 HS]|uniref:hypothetical protein n=1 Tax=unclassified Brevibacillus TaxID=2684853 RepID=UPI0039A1D203